MILEVKAKHFKYTRFFSNCNCALSKAAKEQFNTDNVIESVYDIEIDNVVYYHEEYMDTNFLLDLSTAASHSFDETIIRTIELIEQ